MKKLLLFTVTLVLMSCVQAQAADVNTIKATIVKHAIEMGVDPALALSIAKTESGYRHSAQSSHGAVGVFQLMPSTAKRMGLNPYLLNDNIKGGIMYYKMMYKMFGSMELALAAYNAGPGNVKKYQAVPPYGETKRFVSKIMTDYKYLKANPDPAMKEAASKKNPPKVTAVPSQEKINPVPIAAAPVPKAVKENEPEPVINSKVVAEPPIELEIEAEALAI